MAEHLRRLPAGASQTGFARAAVCGAVLAAFGLLAACGERSPKVDEAADRASGAITEAGDRVDAAIQKAAPKAEALADRAGQGVEDLADAAGDAAAKAGDAVSDAGRTLKGKADKAVDRADREGGS